MDKKRFTITSALLYANGPIHLGHLAGAYLPADIFARYQKQKGHDVAFILIQWLLQSLDIAYNYVFEGIVEAHKIVLHSFLMVQ